MRLMEIRNILGKRPVFYCFLFIFMMYLLPTFVQVEFSNDLRIKGFYLGLPGVLSGDEPHYMVTTTSLVNDGDIYVDNNYDNAYFYGGCDVSYHFVNNTNSMIGRHIEFYDPVKNTVPAKREYPGYNSSAGPHIGDYDATGIRQVSNRAIGLPVFSSIFIWPFRDTCLIEPASIYLGLIVAFIGIIFFYLTCLHYAKRYKSKNSQNIALMFTVIFAIATQYWYYSKSYFTEMYIASFLIIAYYLFFIRKDNLLPGLLLATAFSMKYPIGMYLALFGITLLPRLKWKRIIYFTLGSALPIVGVFYHNWFLTGAILGFRKITTIFFGNYVYGIFVWLFSPSFGLIPFAPFFLFIFPGLWVLYKKDKKTLTNLSLMIFPLFFFWTSYPDTQIVGAAGYSARYLIPLISFFVLLTMIWYINNRSRLLRIIFLILVAIAFLINIQSAFLYFLYWGTPPWAAIVKFISSWHRITFLV